MLVQMLFRDEFIIMVERLNVHLFIWKQKGRCVDLLEKSHSVTNVTMFMSAVKYMVATWQIIQSTIDSKIQQQMVEYYQRLHEKLDHLLQK